VAHDEPVSHPRAAGDFADGALRKSPFTENLACCRQNGRPMGFRVAGALPLWQLRPRHLPNVQLDISVRVCLLLLVTNWSLGSRGQT
jgi:hypothetical protein